MKISTGKIGTLLVVGIAMMSGLGILVAQLPKEDGLAITQEIYTKLLGAMDGDACHLDYVVRTVTLQEGKPVEAIANIDYVANRERMHWVSEKNAMYQDTAVSIAVMTDEKKLFISPSSSHALRERQRRLIDGMRDSLFASAKVVSWKTPDAEDGKESDRMLVLKPSERITRFTMVDTVTVYINTAEKTLQKIRLSYLDKSGIESVEMEYGSLEKIDTPAEFAQPLIDKFFDADHRIRPEYADYTINDMRGKRPRFPERVE